MYLEKIEIAGFKSFANPTTLVFNRELTAVVGPNGSGKSNIADAIRWVLGEQSLKLLRGKKSEDVIFAGSDTKGRLGLARVALHLNNAGGSAAIEYETVVIERVIHRSGESEYLLNGNKVRLSDVQLLLAKAQVGQKGYSVIGQGTIDSLLTFSAQDRRDFFDEATGVRHFQIKKHQALQKLEHTEENLQQAELVLQELDPRLKTLMRQVRRLERKEELERELTALKTNYYSFLFTELNDQLSAIQKKYDVANASVENLSQKLRGLQTSFETNEREDGRKASFNALQSKLFNLQQEYNTLVKKKILVEGHSDLALIKSGDGNRVETKLRLEEVQTKRQTITVTLGELATTQNNASNTISSLEERVRELKSKISTLETNLSQEHTETNFKNIESEINAIAKEHEELKELFQTASHDAWDDLKKRFTKFSNLFSGLLSRIQQKKAGNYSDTWNDFSDATKKLEEVRMAINTARIQFERSEKEITLLKERDNELMLEEKKLISDLSKQAPSHTASSQELTEVTKKLADKEKELEAIRSEIDTFNAREEHKKQELLDKQKEFRTLQYDHTIKNNELTELKINRAKLETRAEDLKREQLQEAPHIKLTELRSLNATATKEQITSHERQLNIIGGIDTETLKEYEDVKEKHTYLTTQTKDLRQAQKTLSGLIAELDEHIDKQFQQSFKNINAAFTKYFKKLFNGGNAKLTLQMQQRRLKKTDPKAEVFENAPHADPAEEPANEDLDYTIEITATPPGKKLGNISMLSGGEKALTSIALISAIIANNPPPFVVLDEVDAALDEANSIRFAEIISELTHKSQFVTITHNRATMHQAKILYGVTMGDDGISRLLSVNFDQADQMSSQ